VPRARRRRRRGVDKDHLGERRKEPHKLVEDDRRLAVGRARALLFSLKILLPTNPIKFGRVEAAK